MANKHKYGQYFTISVIADFMVSLISHPKESKVLEPACGKGIFLDHLTRHGFTNLAAYEIDPTLGKKYDFIQFSSFLSAPISDKYDVIIGNPPYIRWKNIEPELKAELETNTLWNKYFNSLCDYLFIFILKSIEHLRDNGELIFICTEYWMNTTHSASLRNYMCRNGYFEEIYHFKEAPLFEKVTASFIIFKFIKSKEKREHIRLYNYKKTKGLPTIDELIAKNCFSQVTIPHFQENSRWILATQADQDRLAQFESACQQYAKRPDMGLHRIGDICDIGNGMVSGLDAAFQVKDTDNLTIPEQQALIPVMKAKDLCPYKNKGITPYIFLQKNISTKEFEAIYPHFAAQLKPYREQLANRYSYNREIPYWEFVFPRNQKLFERQTPRIFIPCKERVSNKDYFRFCYAPAGCYPTQDVTAILKKQDIRESIEYILAYLNNERVFKWLCLNGIVKGAIVEFSEAPIASIPFRPINWASERETEIHQQITMEVQAYISDTANTHIIHINHLFNILFNE